MHAGIMAKKEQEPPKPCPSCDGNGGWWDTGNGQKFKNRRWVSCSACKGTGKTA